VKAQIEQIINVAEQEDGVSTYLGYRLKHWQQNELDETDLSSRLCDFVSVHERRYWKTLLFLSIRLHTKH
jgi:hypothetical protein